MVLWTQTHIQTLLPSLAVMLLVAVLMRRWMGKMELRKRMIPLQIIAALMLVLEVGKQIDASIGGYDLYAVPLHYCSLLLLLLPLMAFYKGKHAPVVRELAYGVCMAVTVLTVVYPDLIYSAGNIEGYFESYSDFHTVTFHNLAILACFLMLALDVREDGCKKACGPLALFMLGFCVISATMAQLLQTNYNNFYTCNIAPLEAVRQSVEAVAGALAAKLMYVLIVTALDIAFTLGTYTLYRFLAKRMALPSRKALAKI